MKCHEHGKFATTCPVRGRSCCPWTRRDPPASASPRAPRSTSAPSSAPACCCCPALAAQAAGPGVGAGLGRRCWRASLAIAATFAALGVRHPVAGGAAAYVRAAYGRRAGRGHRLVVLRGVVGGAPAVWLIGGFYVAQLTGGGPARRRGGGRRDDGRRAGGQRARPARDGRCSWASPALLAVLLLVAVVDRAAVGARRQLDAVRAAWLARGRHRGEPADALVHRLGGGRAPGRRLRATRAASCRARCSPRFAIVAVLYLGLAVDHGRRRSAARRSKVPLADLMQRGLGGAGSALTAGAAVLLTSARRTPTSPARRKPRRRARAGGLDAARRLARPARAAGRHRRGRRGACSAALAAGARRASTPIVRAISDLLRGGLRRRHRRRRAPARRAPARARRRCRWRWWWSCSPSRAPTSRRPRPSRCWRAPSSVPVRVAQPGGKRSGEPDCRTAWRAGGASPAPANAGSGGSAGRRPRSR